MLTTNASHSRPRPALTTIQTTMFFFCCRLIHLQKEGRLPRRTARAPSRQFNPPSTGKGGCEKKRGKEVDVCVLACELARVCCQHFIEGVFIRWLPPLPPLLPWRSPSKARRIPPISSSSFSPFVTRFSPPRELLARIGRAGCRAASTATTR